MHPTADAIARLQHDARDAVRRHHARRGETRGARADHDDRLGRFRPSGFDGPRRFSDGRLRFSNLSRLLRGILVLVLLRADVFVLVRVLEEPGDDGANHELLLREIGAEFRLDRFADLFLGGCVHVRGAKVRDCALGEELVGDLFGGFGFIGLICGFLRRRLGLGCGRLGR